MNEEEYLEYIEEGKRLFSIIDNELNDASKEFLRRNPSDFRREVDHKEICLALGLLGNLLGIDIE